jgi:hypothetical protein
MNANSAVGLKHSGVTARMSRQAIEEIGWNGQTAIGLNDIADRLPAFVDAPSGGGRMSLADWHNNGALEAQCKNQVFPGMAWGLADKFAPGALGKDLGQITNVHPGDAF